MDILLASWSFLVPCNTMDRGRKTFLLDDLMFHSALSRASFDFANGINIPRENKAALRMGDGKCYLNE